MRNRLIHLLAIFMLALLPVTIIAQTTPADSAAKADTVVSVASGDKHKVNHKKNHKTVAVISSFVQESPWSNDYVPTVTKAVSAVPNVYCETFFLNSIMITDSVQYKKVRDNMFDNFKDKTPDYVVMIGKMAFCMRDDMKKEWGDIPMLLIANSAEIATLNYYFSGTMPTYEANDVRVKKLSDLQGEYNFTSIVVPYATKETIELMVETMRHEINELVFVSAPIYLERNQSGEISAYLAENYPGIRFRWLYADAKNVDELRSLFIEPHPGTGVLMSTWAIPTPGPFGYPIINSQEVKLLSSSANPVFVTSESLMKKGATGGVFCDLSVVENRINVVINSMLNGKRLSDVPIYVCSRTSSLINYKQAQKFGLNLKDLGSDVEYIDRPRSFWQRYHWEVILAGVAVVLLIFGFWKRSQMLAREIKTLQLHQKFVASMPVAYGHATLYFANDDRKVNNVIYSNLNDAMQELINKNGCKTGEYVLFPVDLMNRKAVELFEKGHKIDFLHHFEKTDTYYDVFVDIVDPDNARNQAAHIKEVDIFAVDVTNRVRMEQELKELSHKLDLTINVTGIIPWEWDIKRDVMRFDAYSLFGRQLHDVDDEQNLQAPKGTYLDIYSEYMPLVYEEDHATMERVREGLLTKSCTSFKIRYRLRVVRDAVDVLQWVEVRGRIVEYDENGNPSVCAGGMWMIDDDIISGPLV